MIHSLQFFEAKHPDLTPWQIVRRHRAALEPLLDALEDCAEVDLARRFMAGEDFERRRDLKTIQKVIRKASLLAMARAGEIPMNRLRMRGLEVKERSA